MRAISIVVPVLGLASSAFACIYGSTTNPATGQCACQPGFMGTGESCTACPDNTASTGYDSTTCPPCPTGQMSFSGLPCQPIFCVVGYVLQGSTCVPVAPACPNNSTLASDGVSCGCNAGYVGANGVAPCSACNPGTYSAAGASTCTPCAAGSSAPAGSSTSESSVGPEAVRSHLLCSPVAGLDRPPAANAASVSTRLEPPRALSALVRSPLIVLHLVLTGIHTIVAATPYSAAGSSSASACTSTLGLKVSTCNIDASTCRTSLGFSSRIALR